MINYSIKPIETEYKGILYRSRLEARVACYFDLKNWFHVYEPFEFSSWFP